jgi:hypothetical protein
LRANSADGLGGLSHFRPARRDPFIDPPYSSIDHPDADLDNAKSFQRYIARLSINEPRAEDASDAHCDEQRRERDCAKASYLFENSHTEVGCFSGQVIVMT